MKLRNLISIVILLLYWSQSLAVERWYTVEVIIFAYTSQTGLQQEKWPDDPGLPDLSNTVSLVSGVEVIPGQPVEFQALPMTILANSLAALQRSGRYRVLESAAWRLPGLPARSAPPVLIQAGQRFTDTGTPAAAVDQGNNSGGISLFGNNQTTADSPLHELEGRIKISLTKFLDVDADLILRANVSLPDETGQYVTEFRHFRLKEFRRMKSNTIHYLDHPLFGMVIAIDRYGQE